MRGPEKSYVTKIRGSTARYYIRTVPEDVRAKIGRSKWKLTLGHVDERTAQRKAWELAREHDELIAAARAPSGIAALPAEDRARIEEAGGLDAHIRFLNEQAQQATKLKVEAEELAAWAADDGPGDEIPDRDWARAKLAGMNAERLAIDSHIAREAPLLRQLRIPEAELTRNHPALTDALRSTPLDGDHITLSGALKQWEAQKAPQAPEQFRWPVKLFEERFGPQPLNQIRASRAWGQR